MGVGVFEGVELGYDVPGFVLVGVGVLEGAEVASDVVVFVLVGVGVFEGREVAGDVGVLVSVGVGVSVPCSGGVAEAVGTDVWEYCAVGVGVEEYKDVDVATADGAVEGSEVWVPSANWVTVGSPPWSEPGVADGSWSVGAASEPSSAVQYGVSVATIGA